jgi:glutathione peroxidase
MSSSYSQSFYDISIQSIDDKEIKMSDFKDKYILVVNVASFCGYTSQYTDLQKLSQKYADQLVVLAVPCNQFGAQEPGKPAEIKTFCESNYNITFPLTEKVNVKGDNQHCLYGWLTKKSENGVGDFSVSWNFNKFLVGPKGNLIAYFKSGVSPMDDEITTRIQ